MKERFKPFRLINEIELKNVQERFINELQTWNEHYALFALTLSLSRSSKPDILDNGCLFVSEQQPVALLVEQDLSAISHCLFGDSSKCFNDISEAQLTKLLNQLLGTPSLQRQPLDKHNTKQFDEWFYTGAPSLMMNLSGVVHSLTLYLHPQWVFQALPQRTMSKTLKSNLQEALAPQLLKCQVELDAVRLQLNDIIHLRVGDVIRTDQLLSSPLTLKQMQQTICQVEIGESKHYKSIQIASSL